MGQPELIDGLFIHYNFPLSSYPKISLELDGEQHVSAARLFLEADSFKIFKEWSGCEWDESDEVQDHGHYIHTIHKGSCKMKPIKFLFNTSVNSYEILFNWN